MANTSVPHVYRHLRQLTARQDDAQPDHQLLQRFVMTHDEAAFAALVERHGAMVLGVCRSILHNRHDAEDIFQAAFLVLARKAGSIRRGESVGSWLYAVAYRLAHKARVRADKRRVCEQQAPVLAQAPMDDVTWGELRGILHEEVSRLPEKLRAAVVLCYWEGRTHEQAGQQLGCAKGTVKDRLERARELLRSRLARRGLALSAAWFAASLSGGMASAAVPPELVQTTVRGALLFEMGELPAGIVSDGAVACARRTVQAMALGKLKYGLALVLAIGVFGGMGLAVVREAAPPAYADSPPAPAKAPAAPKQAREGQPDDPLPPGAVARLGTLRFRHGDRIQDVALGADGRSIVSAAGKIVHVWELATGKERTRFEGHEDVVMAVACSPDGKLIASGDRNTFIRLWEPATGREIRRLIGYTERGQPPRGELGFSSLLFTPNSRQLISASGQLDTASGGPEIAICLWDAATGEKVREFGRFGSAWTLALSPDGKTLAAVASKDQWRGIRLWEVATGRERIISAPPHRRMTAFAFSADGKTLAGGVGENDWRRPSEIKLWDAAGEEIRTLQGHKGWVGWLAFAPDGKTVASTSTADVTARLWDVATGKELRHIGPDHWAPINKLLFCPDQKTLVSYGQENALRFWDSTTGKEVCSSGASQSWVGAVSFSPDGRLLASGSADGLIQLWDTATKKEVRRFTHAGWMVALPFSPDGRLLASVGMFDFTARIWEVASGKEVRQIKTPTDFITCMAWSGDGKTLVTWSRQDRVIHLWNPATGKERRRLGPVEEWLNSLAFSPDGRTLAAGVAQHAALAGNSGRGKENILLWATDSGKLLRRLKESAGINCLGFSTDGRTLVAGGMDQSLHLWEMVSGQKRLALKHGERVTSLAYSPDGKLLATTNNKTHTRISSDGTTGPLDLGKPELPRVRLWDMTAEEELAPLEGHQGAVTSLTFSPDGKLLASASNDTTVLLWDATRFRKARPESSQLRPEQIAALWDDLAGNDAVRAYRAIRALAGSPQASVEFLRRHLHPVRPADSKQLARLLADLDGEDFAARDKAMRELEKLGDSAAADLHKALAGKPSLEVKRRIEQLLEGQNGKEHIRVVRALESLERMGTREARSLCEKLAGGVAEARLTREARATLQRLSR
jgi:RNA polymerase sigma factor (sigma-70 family)